MSIPLREQLTLLGAKSTAYPVDPNEAKIETFENPTPDTPYLVVFHCEEFTSRCPLTHQPDFGQLEITYSPKAKCLESKSLKLFLGSFRETGAFWESLIGAICHRLYLELDPRHITVAGRMNVRGGIGMTVSVTLPAGEEKED